MSSCPSPAALVGRRSGVPRRALGLPVAWGAIALFSAAASLGAQEIPSIEDKTEGMTRMEGLFDLYWDEGEGKLWLEVERWGEEFLHQVSLPTGLGSNPVGLDRGQLGRTYVLKAERVGPKVLFIEPNYGYRALSDDAAERRAVEEAFAPSTHWGFKVEARTDDRVLVDATDFFVRDAHGVIQRLKGTGQGTFRLEASRSHVYLPRTQSFPRNTEVEVSLTFTSDEPGGLVRRTAASGEAVTLRQHHSLVELPDGGYAPREADPRIGAFGITFHDYASPIDQPIEVRWVSRHRLNKKDPAAARSEPVEPIVYYLDPGVPEPIRSALLDGARWWNQAFEAAGYIDAFRVEMLPEGADPMDLRYNMIHWTHRSTRGWSYGSSVTDPRTGEILKGNVNLGSLRLRQDHLIATGLGFGRATDGVSSAAAPGGPGLDPGGGDGSRTSRGWRPPALLRDRLAGYAPGASASAGPGAAAAAPVPVEWCDLAAGPTFSYLAAVATNGDPVEMALARIRQLSAHEVGHTLGLAHNFIASTYGRASVMDYPAPLVRIGPNGELDLSDAYDVGIGEYDALAVRWLYGDFPAGTEAASLAAIVQDALEGGIRFISDQDARPAGAAHPLAHLWDNGADPIAALREEAEVRRIGLARFGPEVLREGEPLSALHGVLVPLYLHHRYQVEAALRSVGGADYNYAVRGDGQTPVAVVPAGRQRAALDAVLATLEPSFLAIDEATLDLIPPAAFFSADQERFSSVTYPTFDPLGAARSAADFTVGLLLHPSRLARLAEFHARDASNPGIDEVLSRLVDATWKAAPPADPYEARVAEGTQGVVLARLLEAATGPGGPAVRAAAVASLGALAGWLEARPSPTAYQALAAADLRRWLARPYDAGELEAPSELPPGSPIGTRGSVP